MRLLNISDKSHDISFLMQSSSFYPCSRKCLNKIAAIQQDGYLNGKNKITRVVNYTLTIVKVATLGIVLIISFTAETLMHPIAYGRLKRKIIKQLKLDVSLLTPAQQVNVEMRIRKFIALKELKYTDKRQKEAAIQAAIATYASSLKHYGPVVKCWTKSLLETAVRDNRKLVFLARDGIPAFELAKIFKEKNDRYKDVHLSLAYLSRKLLNNSRDEEILEYIKQCGLEEKDKCLFIDIGFVGSMIDPIRKKLEPLKLDLKFQYLVSLTDKAHGFMSNLQTRLSSIPAAGQNSAVYWLEDTHQGVIDSPTKLIEDVETKKLLPNTVKEQRTCQASDPLSYLLKYWAAEALKAAFDLEDANDENSGTMDVAPDRVKSAFDAFLKSVREGNRVLFIKHK